MNTEEAQNGFRETYARMPDDELLVLAKDYASLNMDAIEALNAELRRRQLNASAPPGSIKHLQNVPKPEKPTGPNKGLKTEREKAVVAGAIWALVGWAALGYKEQIILGLFGWGGSAPAMAFLNLGGMLAVAWGIITVLRGFMKKD